MKRMTRREKEIVEYNWFAKRGVKELFLNRQFQPRIIDVIKDLPDLIIDIDKSYFIFGKSFAGKTILAARMLLQHRKNFHFSVEWKDHHTIEREAPRYVFITTTDLFLKLKETFTTNEAESKIIKSLVDCDLLVLDDFGVMKTSDWSGAILFAILDGRYNLQKQTVITSNFSLDELLGKGIIDDRMYSRIDDMCLRVEKENWG